MKKSRKVPLIVLSIVAAIILVGSLTIFFLLEVISGVDGMIFGKALKLLPESYIAAFAPGSVPTMDAIYGSAELNLVISVVQLVYSGIMLFLVLFGIIYVSCKKRPASLAIQFLFLVSVFVGALLISVGPAGYVAYTDSHAGEAWLPWVLVLAIFSILGFVLTFIIYVLDLAFVSITAKELAEQPEEKAQIISEAAPVQEAEEIKVEEPKPAVVIVPEPEPEPEPEPQPAKEEPKEDLAEMLKNLVRDMVKDEMGRGQQGYNGPLVVQYFGGTPAPAEEAPVEEPAPEPQPEPEPEPQPEPIPEPIPEPVPEPAPVVEEPEKVKYERISFSERLLQSEKDIHDLYNEVKNEILSWGVKSRISANGDTFRLHKKMYVRITVAGKSLKLYFALNPKDYENTTLPIQDASDKDMYQEIPLVFKVKSGLSLRRCKDLIQDVMEKDGLEQGEVGKVNWIKELKAQAAEDEKKAEDDD